MNKNILAFSLFILAAGVLYAFCGGKCCGKCKKPMQKVFSNRVGAIYPSHFSYNTQAAEDNKFMHIIQVEGKEMSDKESTELANKEHQRFTALLIENGVNVDIYEQKNSDALDSIFPDWFFTIKNEDFPEGVFINCPMKTKTRQLERNEEIIQKIRQNYSSFIDLAHYEAKGKALECKGATVYDYRNKKVYVLLSERASFEVANDLIQQLNKVAKNPYKLVVFRSQDEQGQTIYHTDVVMTLLNNHVVLALETITNLTERENLIKELTSPELNIFPNKIFEISFEDVKNMCANMFNLKDKGNNDVLIMSKTAFDQYQKDQNKISVLKQYYKIVASDISTIERIGGGSARCMLIELF